MRHDGRHYNEVRLHSAIGYVTPAARMAGLDRAIFAERDRKLEAAREKEKAQLTEERRRLKEQVIASTMPPEPAPRHGVAIVAVRGLMRWLLS